MKNYKISKDLKELIIYLKNILLISCFPLLVFLIDLIDKNPGLEMLIFYFIFMVLCDISKIIIFIATVSAIKKAKGKYLRNFFDNLKYSTVGIVFITLVLISKHLFKASELYVIPFCYSIIFTIIFGLINKKTKHILAFFTYLICSTVLIPMVLNYFEAPNCIKDILYSIAYIYISVYLAILAYNVRKFIKSKLFKRNA